MRSERETVTTIDGLVLLEAARAATEWVAANRDQLNALNVFPVPDGDTGTNMLLTLREAVTAGQAAARSEAGAGPIAMAMARGAFIGARGNSGVILSQMIQGFAEAIADRERIDGQAMANALSAARIRAYGAVLEPVEGTMLTVIRYAADEAASAVESDPNGAPDLESVLRAALRGAREALALTPELLDILRQANVVDAGGQGVVHFLDGLVQFATGETEAITPPVADGHPLGLDMAFLDTLPASHTHDLSGYCVNFVVVADAPAPFTTVREQFGAFGESVEVIGDERLLRVHLHTEHPGPVLEYAVTLGQLDRIQIDNMGLQTQRLVEQRSQAGPAADAALAVAEVAPGDVAVLSMAAGPGLADALRSLGAAAVIEGGQTMNPSTAEIVAGIKAIPTDRVIVLPNNPNIVLAAQQASNLTDKQVMVVPSRSVPQGLAALTVLAPDSPLADNAEKMSRALTNVRTVEITRAVRDATLDGVAVRAGQAIGFVDDRLVASGDDLVEVAAKAVAAANLAEAELITIFTGASVEGDAANDLRDALLAASSDVAVELVNGGQPHYPFVIAVE